MRSLTLAGPRLRKKRSASTERLVLLEPPRRADPLVDEDHQLLGAIGRAETDDAALREVHQQVLATLG